MASTDETRQLIEGKLLEMGKEPLNVQVELELREQGELILLRDVDGVFLEVEPHVEEPRRSRSSSAPSEELETGEDSAVGSESLRTALYVAQSQNEALVNVMRSLKEGLEREKERVKDMWKLNCAQLSRFDEALSSKEAEIETLKERISQLETAADPSVVPVTLPPSPAVEHRGGVVVRNAGAHRRQGKAPPVNEFTGEEPKYMLDDWLPSLECASQWNAWTEEEKLMQFAGHLRGRALQEWNLLSDDERATFSTAVKSLGSRIDAGCKAVAAQDFRHLQQEDAEPISDLIRRLERTFRVAYGRDSMSTETRDALLYAQLQEALRYELMRAPAMLGSSGYQELCVAAKNEERRLVELRKRQQYSKLAQRVEKAKPSSETQKCAPLDRFTPTVKPAVTTYADTPSDTRKCHYCKKIGHVIRDCRKMSGNAHKSRNPVAKQVTYPASGKVQRICPIRTICSSLRIRMVRRQ